MKILKIILIGTFLMMSGWMLYLATNVNKIEDKPKVAASIFPLYDLVRNIAGEEVTTMLLLPAGASPHTFDPTPQEVKKLAGSKILFAIGHGVDAWTYPLAESAGIKRENIVVVDKNITFMGDGQDPHYWLSVPNAIGICSQIRDELVKMWPEKASKFEENFLTYKSKLEELDKEINSELAVLDNKNIATFHNAWGYFGRDHGTNISSTFEEYPGEEPTAEYLKKFQEQIRTSGVKVIFGEPQFSAKPLEAVAADLGVKISTLDPLGGADERQSYIEMMKYNVNQIVSAYE